MRWVVLLASWVAAAGMVFAGGVSTNAPVHALGGNQVRGPSATIFDAVVRPSELADGVGVFVTRTVGRCRSNALARGLSPNAVANLAGNWLEYAILVALRERELTPAYWQAELDVLPGNFQDVLLWSAEHGPIVISCKTSLRERYKQADLEAVALRGKHPGARCFLVTLEPDRQHLERVRRRLVAGELLGLAAVYDGADLDDLFKLLSLETLVEAPPGALRRATLVR